MKDNNTGRDWRANPITKRYPLSRAKATDKWPFGFDVTDLHERHTAWNRIYIYCVTSSARRQLVIQSGTSVASIKMKRAMLFVRPYTRCASGDPNVNYTLCVASLESVPRARQSDLQGLAVVSVRLAKSNMTRAKSKVKNLLKAKALDPYMESCLETCRELYSNSIAELKDSVKAIKSSRYDDANILISSAVDVPRTCEDGFGEEGLQSPLSEENDELFGLAVIALAITSLLG